MSISRNYRKIISGFISVLLLAVLFFYISPSGFAESFKKFPKLILIGVFSLMVLNTFIVVFRYWRILFHLGFSLSWKMVFRASIAANLASLIIIPLVGQMAGRQAVLQAAGVTPVENAIITAYERIMVGAVSAIFAIIGGGVLLKDVLNQYLIGLPILEIGGVIGVAIVFTLFLGASSFELKLIKSIATGRNLVKLIELIFITMISSLVMLLCFVLLFSIVAPTISLVSLFSAAAIVSFAAGLPISFGGWGLREISSVSILGIFGVSADEALASSILCGVLSIIAVLVFTPFALRSIGYDILKGVNNHQNLSLKPNLENKEKKQSLEKISAWFFSFFIAIFIFFQIKFLYGSSVININLADPFAILSLSVLLLNAVFYRRVPLWKFSYLNEILVFLSLIIVFAYIHGLLSIGVNGWAAGKVFGWFVLLGFMAAGYFTTSYFGIKGFRRVVETMVGVVCVILVVQILLRVLHLCGVLNWSGFTYYIEGYAGNRNALAFQILIVSAAFISLFPLYEKRYLKPFPSVRCETVLVMCLGLMIAGISYSASRSGMASMLLLLSAAGLLKVADWKLLIKSSLLGVVVYLLVVTFPLLFSAEGQPAFSEQGSDAGRLELLRKSFSMWLDAPFFGHGLGVFFANSKEIMGFSVIIHNTVLWLLVEFGVIGLIFFISAFLYILLCAVFGRGIRRARRNAILLIFLCFVSMSIFHEVLYQRVFWFVLGALLAVQFSSVQERTS